MAGTTEQSPDLHISNRYAGNIIDYHDGSKFLRAGVSVVDFRLNNDDSSDVIFSNGKILRIFNPLKKDDDKGIVVFHWQEGELGEEFPDVIVSSIRAQIGNSSSFTHEMLSDDKVANTSDLLTFYTGDKDNEQVIGKVYTFAVAPLGGDFAYEYDMVWLDEKEPA